MKIIVNLLHCHSRALPAVALCEGWEAGIQSIIYFILSLFISFLISFIISLFCICALILKITAKAFPPNLRLKDLKLYSILSEIKQLSILVLAVAIFICILIAL